MDQEHKVDDRPTWAPRKPVRDVWTTVTKARRMDPETRRFRTQKIVIVRWRRPDGGVSERRFENPLEAEVFAQQRREEFRTGSVRARGGSVAFSEWMDTYLSARCIEYVQWKRGEVPSLVGSNYAGLMKVTGDAFLRLVGDRRLDEYTASDFEKFRTLLAAEGKRRPATIESYMQRIAASARAPSLDGRLTRVRLGAILGRIAVPK